MAEYLTTKEVQQRLGLKRPDPIYKYIRSGRLKAKQLQYRKGKPLLIESDSVEEFIRDNERNYS